LKYTVPDRGVAAMNGDDEGLYQDEGTGNVVAEHTPPPPAPIGAARAAQGKSIFNTAAPKDRPVACWKLDEIHFDWAFIEPSASPAFARLAELDKKLESKFKKLQLSRPPLALFGHTDPVGPRNNKEVYNKKLSEARAKAVFAVLTQNPNLWLEIFSGSKRAYLKQRLKCDDANLTDAIAKHMKQLCGSFVLHEWDFLGGGKCAFRGCGQFNPVMVFSKEEDQQYEKNRVERNLENQVNRRVVGFYFKPFNSFESEISGCPLSPDIKGCQERCLPDGDKKRSCDSTRKVFPEAQTFACGTYYRIAGLSPCEAGTGPQSRVLLGFTGDDLYYRDCEKEEVNRLGSVVAYNEDELDDLWRETKYKKQHCKAAESESREWARISAMSFDAYVTESRAAIKAIVDIKYLPPAPPDDSYRVVACVYSPTTREKFAEATVKAKYFVGRSGTWYLASPGDKNREVWRFVDGSLPPGNWKTKNVTEPAGLMEEVKKLHGMLIRDPKTGEDFKTITNLVRNRLYGYTQADLDKEAAAGGN
jgi:hypothetical protein